MALTSAQAEVRIVPTMRGFQASVTRGVKATRVDPLKVQVQIDRRSLAKAEQEARAASDRLAKARASESDAADKVALAERRLQEARSSNASGSAAVLAAEQRLTQSRRGLVQATSAAQRAMVDEESAKVRVQKATDSLSASNRRAESSVGRLTSGLIRLSNVIPEQRLRAMDSAMSSSGRSALRFAGYTSLAASAVTTLSAGTGAVLALGSAMVTASGSAALLPGAILAAGAAYGTLKVGMTGVGDALKGDAEALNSLAPAARATVTELTSLRGQWDQLRAAVQQRMFANTSQDVSMLATTYLPILQRGMVGIAGGFNDAVRSMTWFLQSAPGVNNVTAILQGTAGATSNLGQAAGPIAGILTGIGAVGASMLPGLTDGFAGAAQRASDFVNSAAGAQQIRGWITGGLEAVRQIATFLGTVGGIIFHVFSVANQVGGSTLQTINGILAGVLQWLQSAEGMHFLVTVFSAIRDTVNALLPGVRAVWGALAGLVLQVAPLLPQVGHAFSAIAVALAPVIGWLGNLISWILPPLLGFVINFPGLALGVVGGFLGIFGAVKLFISIASGIGAVTSAINAVRNATWLVTAAQWLWNSSLLASPITWVVIGILALVAAVIYAWHNFDWFRNAVLAVWEWLKQAGAWISGVFVAIWNGLAAAVQWVGGVLAAAWAGIVAGFQWLGSIFMWVYTNVLRPVFDGFLAVARFVGSLIIALVIGPLVLAWQGLAAAFRWAYDNILAPMFQAFRMIALWLYVNVLVPIFNGIRTAWNALLIAFRWVYDTILVPMFMAFRVIAQWLYLNVLVPIFIGIRTAWNALLTAFRWIYDSILVPLFNAFRTIADWLYRNILVPIFDGIRRAWDGLAAAFRWIYDKIIAPVFGLFQSAGESFRIAFDRIVAGIRNIWNTLKDAFKAPVRFVLDVVWNQGVGGLWNAAKTVFPLGEFPNANNAIAALDRFATGGRVLGPGGPTDDKIPALLSNGEHVLTAAEVRAAGGHDKVEKMRAQIRAGVSPTSDAFYALPRRLGGPVTWQELWGSVRAQFPQARLTSDYRAGDPGYHGRGMAVDIAGPRSMDMPFMLAVNRWIAGKYANSAELIHTQPGAVNLKNGRPHTYNAGTQADHRNHVHWANGGALERAGNWIGNTIASFVDSLTSVLGGPEKWIRDTVGAAFPSGPGDPLTKRFPMLAMDWAIKTAKDWLFGEAAKKDAELGAGGLAPGGTGPVADQVRAVANRFGWGGGPQWDALSRLIHKESSWNPLADNPTSTAFGLFQFLDSTWGTVGGRRTSNPGEQAEYGLRYIKNRYRDPMGALAFHNRNNWYDTGGWLKTGVTRVFNGTGKPEAVLTDPQWEVASAAIDQVKRARDLANVGRPATVERGQVFGDVHVHESVDMDAALNRASFLASGM